MLNIVSIIDNYTDRLNNIFDISNKSKKKFVNRNILIINKFFDLFLKEKRKLFLNNSFDCIRFVINNNLIFLNNIIHLVIKRAKNLILRDLTK